MCIRDSIITNCFDILNKKYPELFYMGLLQEVDLVFSLVLNNGELFFFEVACPEEILRGTFNFRTLEEKKTGETVEPLLLNSFYIRSQQEQWLLFRLLRLLFC